VCPSVDAVSCSSLTTPIASKITGHKRLNEATCICWSRNSTPIVMSTTGPINPRREHRWHVHVVPFAIFPFLLKIRPSALPKHPRAYPDQNDGQAVHQNPIEGQDVKIVQKKQGAQSDQHNWADRCVRWPPFFRA
jgi:hypothetical protein